MTKGLDFIWSNFSSTMDEEQHSSVGFEVIFPTMIDHAINLDVNFHLPKEDVEAILKKKDFELERIRCKNTRVRNHCLAFISEGMVPTVYSSDMYARLRMVDKLQRLRIDRHFTENIRNVLDEAFRIHKFWIQDHEDLFSDIATSALAFRLLCLLGY
ncbi:hypothetical protein Droror1_Dr00011991, partial [Drosera rotundifolia]